MEIAFLFLFYFGVIWGMYQSGFNKTGGDVYEEICLEDLIGLWGC